MENLIKDEVRCAVCGSEIVEIEAVEIDERNNKIGVTKIGQCCRCCCRYVWDEVFRYGGHTEVKRLLDEEECEIDED